MPTLKQSYEIALKVAQDYGTRMKSGAITADEREAAKAALAEVQRIGAELKAENDFQSKVDGIGNMLGGGTVSTPEGGLGAAIMAAGYNRKTQPQAVVEFKAVTGFTEDAVTARVNDPLLAFDKRFLYPNLRTEMVGNDETSVQTYRQADRTLGVAADGVRAIDATSTKPEAGTEVEIVNTPLFQLAYIQTVPNIVLEDSNAAKWIQEDLRLSWSRAVDVMAIDALEAAGMTSGAYSAVVPASWLNAIEVVAGNGYAVDTIVATQAQFNTLALLTDDGGFVAQKLDYLFAGMRKVAVSTPLAAPFVMDSRAIGTFYVSPLRFETFEADSGKTNSTVARLEANGVFVAQRPGAGAVVDILP